MRRRDLLLGSVATAVAAVWSRLAGAVPILRPAPPPVAARFLSAGEILDKILRDRHRRLMDDEAFDTAFDRALNILRANNRGQIDSAEAARRMLVVRWGALQHPPPRRQIPPIPADEVGVAEAMVLLRRVISGESRIRLERPWEVVHTLGKFEIDGWRLLGFRRTAGIKYLDRAVAPDGRVGTYDSWSAREGNPVHLLTNDEQDKLDDLIEGIDL